MSTTIELPLAPAATPRPRRDAHAALARRVELLSWLLLAWMTAVRLGSAATYGEGCGCCASPLEGVLVADADRQDACCR